MSDQPPNSDPPQPPDPGDEDDDSPLDFDPVCRRFRADGWTPGRQEDFIRALAESGCVEEAARRVGKSASGAYALRALPEAQSVEGS